MPGSSGAGRGRALVHSPRPPGAHARFRQAERGWDCRARPAGRYQDAWRVSVGERPRRATSERGVFALPGASRELWQLFSPLPSAGVRLPGGPLLWVSVPWRRLSRLHPVRGCRGFFTP